MSRYVIRAGMVSRDPAGQPAVWVLEGYEADELHHAEMFRNLLFNTHKGRTGDNLLLVGIADTISGASVSEWIVQRGQIVSKSEAGA